MPPHMHYSYKNSSAAHIRYKLISPIAIRDIRIWKSKPNRACLDFVLKDWAWLCQQFSTEGMSSTGRFLYSCSIYSRQHWHCVLCLSWDPQVSDMLSKAAQCSLPLKSLHRCLPEHLTFNSINTLCVNDRPLYILTNSSTPTHIQVSYWSFCHGDLVQVAQRQ